LGDDDDDDDDGTKEVGGEKTTMMERIAQIATESQLLIPALLGYESRGPPALSQAEAQKRASSQSAGLAEPRVPTIRDLGSGVARR